jgi:V-type H+-transporting ATPase subunit C
MVSQVQVSVAKVDEELKKLAMGYNEKVQTLSSVQRKKTTNLVTSDLEDFLSVETVNNNEFLNSEYLLTVLCVVPGANENDFLKLYETLGDDIAVYGGPDWTASFNPAAIGKDDGNYGPEGNRDRLKGSAVVPGSAKKVHKEGENYLYSFTILKGHYEAGYYEGDEFVPGKFVSYLDAVRNAFRDKRFPIREFVFDPSKAGGVDGQIEQAKWEVQQTLTTIVRWCRAHYGEVFSSWIHLKVIKSFVESVLRYGLPVDFLPMFIEPNMKKEKAV